MRHLHHLLVLVLSIALTLGSVATVLARGQPMAVGQMVICASDLGETVVLIDAEGRPVAHRSCPDCLAGGAAALAVPPGAPGPEWRLTTIPFALPAARKALPPCDLAAFARGPPALV